MIIAPIALFTYNRVWHAQQTVEALQKNELADVSELIIFSDGPKSVTDKDKVRSVRDYFKKVTGFKKVTLIERDKNLGLAQSVIAGVTEIVNRYGCIIVLEDDMITSPYFLKFMNEALEFYKDEEKVMSVHGYIYPVEAKLPETFFLRGADCWGWATWKRGWNMFEADGNKLLIDLKTRRLTYRFDFDGSYSYTKMLEDQVKGKNDSWAIRWYASAFLKNKLTLYPGRSLIFNIGTDASGTHCEAVNTFDAKISHEHVNIAHIPLEEEENARQEITRYFRAFRTSLGRAIANRARRILSRCT